MIIKLDNPNKEPCMFKAQISTNKKTLIGIAVYCAKKPYTFYTYNKTYVNGKRVVDIRLPICPKNGYIRIWNAEAKTAKGKESGWIDCNAPDGDGGYKACGRKKGEKRSQYPACRPTAAQCKTKGKGKTWGKTK